MRKTIIITVSGKVQGVYYRQSTKAKAISLGLTGYVKNQPDKTVSIVATGTDIELTALINWCRQGPPAAVVTKVVVEDSPLMEFDHFIIRRD